MRLHSFIFSGFSYHRSILFSRQLFLLLFVGALVGCTGSSMSGKNVTGIVSVNDKTIAKTGVQVLEQGGNAADAMSAMLMSGAVVLPSRIGLGAGGVCQILDPAEGRVKTLDFLSTPMSFDRQIGVPALARGVYTLQNKYGQKPWRDVLSFAKGQAQNGVNVSELLALDIVTTGGLNASWKKLKKGDLLKQPQLAKTLDTLASSGAGVIYSGALASSIVNQSEQIIQEDLKNFKASFMDSIDVTTASGKTFFPNPSVLSSDAYMIWRNAQSDKPARQTQALEMMKKLEDKLSPIDKRVRGASLIAADKSGLVVMCSVSMGQAFGTGQLLEQGFYLGSLVDAQEDVSAFANLMQTNPDVTDVLNALSAVGDYAVFDAMNDWSYALTGAKLTQEEDSLNDKHSDKASFVGIYCEKGYPNQPVSCRQDKDFYFAEQKE